MPWLSSCFNNMKFFFFNIRCVREVWRTTTITITGYVTLYYLTTGIFRVPGVFAGPLDLVFAVGAWSY